MRKIDFLILLSVCGVSALFLARLKPAAQPTSVSGSPIASSPAASATPVPKLLSKSGRWEVLAGTYRVAGLSMGASDSEVIQHLGQPTRKEESNAETHQWLYQSDGGELTLTLLEGRLVGAGAVRGRWSLSQQEQNLPAFMASRAEVEAAWGQPTRVDQGGSVWVYSRRPNEVTYHFENDRVSQVWVTAEIKPRPVGGDL